MPPRSRGDVPLRWTAARRRPGLSLRALIHRSCLDAIVEGRIAPGERLPSARQLAADWRVSRNTVDDALAALQAEGLLERRVGAGTFVAAAVCRAARSGSRAAAAERVGTRCAAAAVAMEPRCRGRSRARRVAEAAGVHRRSAGRRAVPARPVAQADRAPPADQRARRLPDTCRRSDCPRCRRRRHGTSRRSRGLVCEPRPDPRAEQHDAGGGPDRARAARARPARVDRGSVVSEPALGAGAFRSAARAGPCRRSGHRCRRRRCARAERRALAYVTPSCHYPLGVTLSMERRRALLDWAARRGAWIVEDDYQSEFIYEGRAHAPLASLERNGRVLHVGTFTQRGVPVAAPRLRRAAAARWSTCSPRCAASSTITRTASRRRCSPTSSTPAISPRTCAACAAVYEARRDALVRACARDLPDGVDARSGRPRA